MQAHNLKSSLVIQFLPCLYQFICPIIPDRRSDQLELETSVWVSGNECCYSAHSEQTRAKGETQCNLLLAVTS